MMVKQDRSQMRQCQDLPMGDRMPHTGESAELPVLAVERLTAGHLLFSRMPLVRLCPLALVALWGPSLLHRLLS